MNLDIQQPQRRTYSQDWRAYNCAQVHEKQEFLQLLHDLCGGLVETVPQKRGRPRLSIQDGVFAACYKIFSTMSARRFMTDLRDAKDKGFISTVPHFNSIFAVLQNPQLTSVLTQMIVESSLPLKSLESDFAVDSTGFTTSKFICWVDHKYGEVRKDHSWVKVHVMTGTRTNVITAVEIRDRNASDTKLLPDLLETTAENFTVREVSGDKAYGSFRNYAAIEAKGATPYIAFKSIHTGSGRNHHGGNSDLWRKMYHHFQFNRDDFMQHYHRRSNVESTFSMVKRKFGDSVRSKTETAQINECLAKILCHNLCCLISATHELGIDVQLGVA